MWKEDSTWGGFDHCVVLSPLSWRHRGYSRSYVSSKSYSRRSDWSVAIGGGVHLYLGLHFGAGRTSPVPSNFKKSWTPTRPGPVSPLSVGPSTSSVQRRGRWNTGEGSGQESVRVLVSEFKCYTTHVQRLDGSRYYPTTKMKGKYLHRLNGGYQWRRQFDEAPDSKCIVGTLDGVWTPTLLLQKLA